MSDNIQVLIVEDDITSSEVLELLLKHEDVLATTVTRSDHTMVVLHQIPAIRIVFVDLELPDAWGYEVLRAIRADPAFADLTVVAYTAHLSELVQDRKSTRLNSSH